VAQWQQGPCRRRVMLRWTHWRCGLLSKGRPWPTCRHKCPVSKYGHAAYVIHIHPSPFNLCLRAVVPVCVTALVPECVTALVQAALHADVIGGRWGMGLQRGTWRNCSKSGRRRTQRPAKHKKRNRMAIASWTRSKQTYSATRRKVLVDRYTHTHTVRHTPTDECASRRRVVARGQYHTH
jgi:hypothetical protein